MRFLYPMGLLCPKFTFLLLQIYHNSVLIKQALSKYFLTNTYTWVNILQSLRFSAHNISFTKYSRLYTAAPACKLVNVLINGAASFRRIKEEAANRIKDQAAKSKDFRFFRYFRQCLLTKRWPQPALHLPYASVFAMTKGEHRAVPLIVADPSASGNWRKEKVRNGALRKKICLSVASSFFLRVSMFLKGQKEPFVNPRGFSFSVMSSFLANLTQTRLFGSFSAEGKGTSMAGNEAREEVCKAKKDGLYHETFHSVQHDASMGIIGCLRQSTRTRRWPQPAEHQSNASVFAMIKGEHRAVPLIVADPSASGNWRKEKVRNGASRKKICLSVASSFSFSGMSSFLANLTQTRLFGSFSAEGKGTSMAGNEAGEEVCKAKKDGLYHETFQSVQHDALRLERLEGKDHKNLYDKILKQPFKSLPRQASTQGNNSVRHAINKFLNPNKKNER